MHQNRSIARPSTALAMFNLALAVAAIWLTAGASGGMLRLYPLQAEFQRLTDLRDKIEVADPQKTYVRFLGRTDPFTFGWRIYKPRYVDGRVWPANESGVRQRGVFNSSVDTIFTLRFYFDEHEETLAYSCSGYECNDPRQIQVCSGKGFDQIAKNWQDLNFTIGGECETWSRGPNQPFDLIEIQIPDQITREMTSSESANWPASIFRLEIAKTSQTNER